MDLLGRIWALIRYDSLDLKADGLIAGNCIDVISSHCCEEGIVILNHPFSLVKGWELGHFAESCLFRGD